MGERKIRDHQKPDLSDEKEILMLKIASIHEYFCKKLINITKAKIFNFYCDNGKKTVRSQSRTSDMLMNSMFLRNSW